MDLVPRHADEKKHSRRELLRRLVGEVVRPYWARLGIALVLMGIVAAANGASAWLLQPVVDDVFVGHDRALLWIIGGAVAATFIVKSGASYAQESLLAWVGQRVIADLQNRLFRHLIRHDVALVQARHSGQLVSHFTYDINTMRAAVSGSLVGLGRDSLSVLFLAGVMLYQDWRLTLVVLLVAPATIYPLDLLRRRMRRVSIGLQDEMGALTASLSQSFQGIRVIKSFGTEEHESTRLAAVVERLFGLSFHAAKINAAMQPIVDAFGGIAIACVVVYAGMHIMAGKTTPGAFFSFIAAVMTAYQPLRAISKVMPLLDQGLAAAERIFALLDMRTQVAEAENAPPLPRVAGEIRFEKVCFTYGDAAAALDGADFVAPAGKMTALVGPSGAGKTTVFNLLPRFYDAQSGHVFVNGRDVKEVSQASLRDALAIVGQDVTLFDDTVLNNIRYGRLAASDEEIRAAARLAAAEEFIDAMPQGFETLIGEHGMRLSGGQRQRLAIARAILKDAPILLLDEATSALDTESERQIQEALQRLIRGRTTLVIAHRLSTIQRADLIHVMEAGRVRESGTHQDLLRRGGLYARLHALQFAAEPG